MKRFHVLAFAAAVLLAAPSLPLSAQTAEPVPTLAQEVIRTGHVVTPEALAEAQAAAALPTAIALDPATGRPLGSPNPWLALIPFAVPFVVAFFKTLFPQLPSRYVPILAFLHGPGLALLDQATGIFGHNPLAVVMFGLAGVGVREIYNQWSKDGASVKPMASALIAGGLLLFFGTGCSSYKHERFTDAGQPIERTTFSAPWLSKTTVENLKSRVNEKRGTNTYSRSFGIDSAEAKTDVEGVQALQSLIGASLLQALKTGAEVAK